MTENYLVLDDVYYWYLEETQYESSAKWRMHKLKEEGKEIAMVTTLTNKKFPVFIYTIYEKDKDSLEVTFPNR